jgi:hypothetical protein
MPILSSRAAQNALLNVQRFRDMLEPPAAPPATKQWGVFPPRVDELKCFFFKD